MKKLSIALKKAQKKFDDDATWQNCIMFIAICFIMFLISNILDHDLKTDLDIENKMITPINKVGNS